MRRLVPPLGVAAVLLAVPAAYALWGPRSLKGNIWGPGFNPDTGGTSFLDLVRPHVVAAKLTALSGYTGPAGRPAAAARVGMSSSRPHGLARVAVARRRSSRVAALTAAALRRALASARSTSRGRRGSGSGGSRSSRTSCSSGSPSSPCSPAIVVIARGVAALERARATRAGGRRAVVLAGVAIPVAIPVAQSLPLRTVHVAVPHVVARGGGPGVVLAYPYPSTVLQGPLSWQAHGGFAVADARRQRPAGHATSRAGDDAAATAVLTRCPRSSRGRPTATAAERRARSARWSLRDGVTEVVVPVTLHGRFLATGAAERARGASSSPRCWASRRRVRRRRLGLPRHRRRCAAPHLVTCRVAAALRAARRDGRRRARALRARGADAMTGQPPGRSTDGTTPPTPSTRASVRDALVVAVAGLVANGLNLVVTIVLARVLPVRDHSAAYGAFAQMVGLFLVVSLPGSAIAIAVVRRSSWWLARGGNAELEAWRRHVARQMVRALGVFAVVAAVAVAVRREGARRAQLARGPRSRRSRRAAGLRSPSSARSSSPAARYHPLAANFLAGGAGAHRGGAHRRRARGRHRARSRASSSPSS